jgi:hypothetical protein
MSCSNVAGKKSESDMSEKERLLRALFDHKERTHLNVKFCRGTSANLTAEDLCREANSAMLQAETGLVKAEDCPVENFVEVEVKDFVAAA